MPGAQSCDGQGLRVQRSVKALTGLLFRGLKLEVTLYLSINPYHDNTDFKSRV